MQDAMRMAGYAQCVRENDVVTGKGRLARQWRGYAETHTSRRNLVVHAATVPLFMIGTLLLVSASWGSGGLAAAGLLAMVLSIAAQGRGHASEHQPPKPFLGPLDVVLRLLGEQWITFPRFVFTGGFRRAWAKSRTNANVLSPRS